MNLDDLDFFSALERAGVKKRPRSKQVKRWPWERRLQLFYALGYMPTPAQASFHSSPARFKIMCAGARFGKSLAASKEALDIILTPNTNVWCLGPTYQQAEREWDYIIDDLAKLGFLQMATQSRNSNPRQIIFPWGSRLGTRSADHPASLLGEEVDLVLVGEAAQIQERVITRFVRPRLGSRLGRIVIPTTPAGFNWVRQWWDRGQGDQAEKWEETFQSWQFSVLENPYFSVTEYLAAKRDMPPEEFAEQYDGRFTSLGGRIFPMFERSRHVFDPKQMPERVHAMPIFRGIDFGFTNPSCCLWMAFDMTGEVTGKKMSWIVVAEIYKKQLLTEDLADQIKAHPWSKAHRIMATVGDMADAQARATLTRRGVPCAEDVTRLVDDKKAPIDKAWEAGIRTLRAMFHQGRILISEECPNLIREIAEAQFPEGVDNRQEMGQDDHAIDPLRYVIHSLTPI